LQPYILNCLQMSHVTRLSTFSPPITPRHPTTLLFPYTTLFRSNPSDRANFVAPLIHDPNIANRIYFGTFRVWLSTDAGENWTERDRKSTRLNSSHQIISYAVFCLKKKITECIMMIILQYTLRWY